jgi:murein DD-endopeptidase MepM/ murein hydrolase activator NlpD
MGERVVEGRTMYEALRQEARRRINVTFPARQIYIRSDGRVQFFTFDPMMQAILAGASLLVLGWVAFTSVNVIFKDRIIAAKERHFVEMQSAYESRIADLQVSYDELSGALTEAEDHFAAVADSFEAKQRALANLIGHKQTLESSLGISPTTIAQNGSAGPPTIRSTLPLPAPAAPAETAYYGLGSSVSQMASNFASLLALPSSAGIGALRTSPPFSPSSVPPMMPREAGLSAIPEPAFLRSAVERLGAFFGRKVAANDIDNPSLHHIAEEQARLARLDDVNPTLLTETKQDFDKEVARLTRIFRATGIDPKAFAALAGRPSQNLSSAPAQGGPMLPIGPTQIATPDQSFNAGVAGAIGSLSALTEIVASLHSVPLAQPLTSGELTSGFGARSDPFTENFAFHTGLDYSAPKGTNVHVTAPGVVVYAARFGDYGNTVEVDHGNHIRTRYGHLSQIGVTVGDRLEKGDIIGFVGSTGRSTGPHVHYEVWYDDVVRDPGRFIRAGHDVLKN